MQLIGRPRADAELLSVVAAYHEATEPLHDQPPPFP
jgi:hypothetical protein